jgi:serpin B
MITPLQSSSPTPSTPQPIVTPQPQVTVDIAKTSNAFGFKVFKELYKLEGHTKNIAFSPLILFSALSMTLNGADKETKKAMQQTLGLENVAPDVINQANKSLMDKLNSADPRNMLQTANSLWLNKKGEIAFSPDFIKSSQESYNAKVSLLDFLSPEAVPTINSWVKEATKEKNPYDFIYKILDTNIDPEASAYLINAFYFKGIWSYGFEKSADSTFTLLDGSEKEQPMMITESLMPYFEFTDARGHTFSDKTKTVLDENEKQHPLLNKKTTLRYLQNNCCRAISIPYGNGSYRFYIFLPYTDSSLDQFLSSLTADNLNQWMEEFYENYVTFIMPRFKVEYETLPTKENPILKDVLSNLGMGIAFSPDKADFSKLVPNTFALDKRVHISDIRQKTFLEVNEKGIEAPVEIVYRLDVYVPDFLLVNRPFFYAIRDEETGALLFIGTIVDPEI